jgi:molybdopterin-synthase adenylyltransferase
MGSFAAMEAIRALTRFGDPQTGKLHIFDGMTPSMRSIRLPKDPACRSCGSAV